MAELYYAGVDVAKDTVELALGPKASVESFANEPSGHEAIGVAFRHTSTRVRASSSVR
jgi:hypothetical protein